MHQFHVSVVVGKVLGIMSSSTMQPTAIFFHVSFGSSSRPSSFSKEGTSVLLCTVLKKAEDGNERDEYKGSSTACVVLIDTLQGQLKSANVGDSGYLLIGRHGSQLTVKYHSPQQEHSFGHPYQLGHFEGADAPEDAMLMTVPVRLSPLSPLLGVVLPPSGSMAGCSWHNSHLAIAAYVQLQLQKSCKQVGVC